MPAVVNVEANAWMDDRSEAGRLRTDDVRGDAVVQPFRPALYRALENGTSTQTFRYGDASESDAGIGSYVDISIASGAPGTAQGVQLWLPFYGALFGVVFFSSATSSGQIQEFTVGVDNEYRRVKTVDPWVLARSTAVFGALGDSASLVLPFTDLDPGRHIAEIIFHGTAATTLKLLGWVGSRRAGYSDHRRAMKPYRSVLTTTAARIPVGASDFQDGRVVRKVLYKNNDDAGARTVVIENSGTTVYRIPLAQGGTTGDSAELDFGEGVALSTSWTHKAGEADSGAGKTIQSTAIMGT